MKLKFLLFLLMVWCAAKSSNVSSYFQQEVNYKINVSLNDKKHSLHANIEIEYINHSPDTLKEIWFHLWPNAYKDRSSALCAQLLESGDASLYFAEEKERGYIDSLQFTANDEIISWAPDKNNIDICVLNLKKPLLPGNRVFIRTPFFVKIPSGRFSRLGHIGQAYAITQWYPKPAVYDQNGWHPIPYLTMGEFYAEYGSFDVSITVPKNYVVGATGDLQTASEAEWMKEKSKASYPVSKDMDFPASAADFKTIRFTQTNIHDFAWFADKRFHVQMSEVLLPGSGKKVTTCALFTNVEAALWQKSTQYMNNALFNYSKWIGDYPYLNCTAVDGTIAAGGGMEYPNITIIGKSEYPEILETVITHELGHNWFYGILGSNERIHPWMDEGINSYYESRYVMSKYPHALFGNVNEYSNLTFISKLFGINKLNYNEFSFFEYLLSSSCHTDQAIEVPAPNFTELNYGTIVYKKTAVAFYYLNQYLGDSIFDLCMQTYYMRWKFKHPQPEDLKAIFTEVSGRNLDWFFNDLLSSTNQQDFKFAFKEQDEYGFKIKVTDKSGLKSPFKITARRAEKSAFEKWYEPSDLDTFLLINCKECDDLTIDADAASLDVNKKNNGYRRNFFPVIHILPKVNTTNRSMLFITPALAWNNYDKFMPGLVVSNSLLPFKNFEYYLAPLYSSGNKTLSGNGIIKYSFYPSHSVFHEIRIDNSFRKFAYLEDTYKSESQSLITDLFAYSRYSPSLIFYLKKKFPRSQIQQAIQLSSIHLWEENAQYNLEASPSFAKKETAYTDFYRANYVYKDKRALDPWSLFVQAEFNKEVAKAETELKYRISYKVKNKGADIRVFGGYTFCDNADGAYGFFLSDRNGVRGSNDYAYDEWYLGRSETDGFLFSQMALRQGAFKMYTPFGAYKSWILAMNIQAELPIPLPIRFYLDLGTTDGFKSDIKKVYDINATLSYNAGLCFSLAKNVLEIYFPLFKSEEIKEYLKTNEIKYGEQIRFVFNISKLNPLNLRNQINR